MADRFRGYCKVHFSLIRNVFAIKCQGQCILTHCTRTAGKGTRMRAQMHTKKVH